MVAAFSPTALAFAAVLGATGALAAWRHLGSWSALASTEYGRVLLLKLALVGLLAGLGAVNWKRVLPRLGLPSATATLRRVARGECAVMVLVFVVTAILVATEMPELQTPAQPSTPSPLTQLE